MPSRSTSSERHVRRDRHRDDRGRHYGDRRRSRSHDDRESQSTTNTTTTTTNRRRARSPRSQSPRNRKRAHTREDMTSSDVKKRHRADRTRHDEIIEPKMGQKSTATTNTDRSAVTEDVGKQQEKKKMDPLLMRTGGAYIPPAKLRLMQQQIEDKSSSEYQRMNWEALKKSIHGLINKVNTSNIEPIVLELLRENIVRGRGLFVRSCIQAQSISPTFTHVYAALIATINSKFPQVGELTLQRVIINFRKGFRRNDKQMCLSSARYIAHLINQQVAHEVLALEVLTLLLETPTDDSIEIAIAFLKECGQKLTEVSPRGINAIFERLRSILHEAEIDKRVQYMVEVMFAIRKDGFKEFPSIVPEMKTIEDEADQFTHLLTLDDEHKPEDGLNVFKVDPDFLENEEKYKKIREDILEDSGSDDDDSDGSTGSDNDENEEENEEEKQTIIDQTETNLGALRRVIYLTVQSSLNVDECAHKLLKTEIKPNQEKEVCLMILDCCAQERSFEKFFGLLGQRFCTLKKEYMNHFEIIFAESYDTIHRLEANKLRNVAKFFAHLLYSDALPWTVIECFHLNEEETTSSSRIFIKILFQEVSEYLGLPKLNARLNDPTLLPYFEGLLPRDNPKNTRFAINFFTSIGLGGLTDGLREHLKSAPKQPVVLPPEINSDAQESEEESEDSSDSSEDSSDSEKKKKKKSKEKKREKKTEPEVKRRNSSKPSRQSPIDEPRNREDGKSSSGGQKSVREEERVPSRGNKPKHHHHHRVENVEKNIEEKEWDHLLEEQKQHVSKSRKSRRSEEGRGSREKLRHHESDTENNSHRTNGAERKRHRREDSQPLHEVQKYAVSQPTTARRNKKLKNKSKDSAVSSSDGSDSEKSEKAKSSSTESSSEVDESSEEGEIIEDKTRDRNEHRRSSTDRGRDRDNKKDKHSKTSSNRVSSPHDRRSSNTTHRSKEQHHRARAGRDRR